MVQRFFVQSTLLLSLIGCSTGTELKGETLTAACAMCVLKMEGANSCYWAVEYKGKNIPATGSGIPLDHQSHAPDGMCNMRRKVIVDGTIKNNQLFATRFELLPAADVPAKPTYTDADKH